MQRQEDPITQTVVRLPPTPESVREARRFVASVLDGWSTLGTVEVVVLLTSEVVTNAVLHAGPHAPSDELVLTLTLHGDLVRVEVRDPGDGALVRRDGTHEALSGRGLLLLDALASDWEVRPDRPGKVVCFQVRAEAV